MNAADLALAAAQKAIAMTADRGTPALDLNPDADPIFAARETLPPGILALRSRKRLSLRRTGFAVLSPLAAITRLQMLFPTETPATDLAPLAGLRRNLCAIN